MANYLQQLLSDTLSEIHAITANAEDKSAAHLINANLHIKLRAMLVTTTGSNSATDQILAAYVQSFLAITCKEHQAESTSAAKKALLSAINLTDSQ